MERWGQLVMQFRRENFQLHQLNDQSALAVTLQAGLSALKTPYPFFHQINLSFQQGFTISNGQNPLSLCYSISPDSFSDRVNNRKLSFFGLFVYTKFSVPKLLLTVQINTGSDPLEVKVQF